MSSSSPPFTCHVLVCVVELSLSDHGTEFKWSSPSRNRSDSSPSPSPSQSLSLCLYFSSRSSSSSAATIHLQSATWRPVSEIEPYLKMKKNPA
eukprot:768069-Hanusia_phi.AAC.2